MRRLGIDYGTKRVGLALSDASGRFALPYGVLPAGEKLVAKIKEICEQEQVGEIILGESKNWRGEDNPVMRQIKKLKKELEQGTGLPVIFESEFLTSVAAAREQGETSSLDASAAALILQSYLERITNKI